jgi:hypothetical protein
MNGMKFQLNLPPNIFSLARSYSSDITCTVCKEGLKFDESFEDKTISLPLKPQTITLTCAMLNASLPFLVSNATSDSCSLIQSLGPLCGCPTPLNACTLCSDGSSCQSPNLELPFFEEMFGFIPTCELIEAYLKSEYENESSMCTVSQKLLSNYCGCNGLKIESGCNFCSDGQSVGFPKKNLNITSIPLDTCQQLESALLLVVESGSQTCLDFQRFSSYCGCSVIKNSCEMCPHGVLTFPEKEVEILQGAYTIGPLVPTCKIIEAIARSTESETKECLLSQMIGGYCGCPPINDHCLWCRSHGIPESYLDHKVLPEALKVVTGFQPANAFSCREAQNFLTQVSSSDKVCDVVQYRGDICGCYEGGFGYFGTEGYPERRKAISILARISASFSIVSVSIICIDVLRDRNRRSNLYCQLMLGMSLFDFFYSVAWIAFSSPIPFDPVNTVLGAAGNSMTCKAQSFFFQLGLTSIFYNASLKTYYFFIIILSKRESWLKKQKWWLHGIPIIAGLSVAGASIPFASNNYYGCHVRISNTIDQSTIYLFIVPVIFVLTYSTLIIFIILLKVHLHKSKVYRWRYISDLDMNVVTGDCAYPSAIRHRPKKASVLDKLQRRVTVQAFLYLAALWCTWPLFLVPFFAFKRLKNLPEPWQYVFYVLVFILAPLQGFLNALIYFRARIVSFLRNVNRKISSTARSSCTHPIQPRGRESKRGSSIQFFLKQIDLDDLPNDSDHERDEFDVNLDHCSRFKDKLEGGGLQVNESGD